MRLWQATYPEGLCSQRIEVVAQGGGIRPGAPAHLDPRAVMDRDAGPARESAAQISRPRRAERVTARLTISVDARSRS
jgi:hypothetical protein